VTTVGPGVIALRRLAYDGCGDRTRTVRLEMTQEENGAPKTRNAFARGPSRRSALVTGAAAAALFGFPYISRASAAQSLKFWQIYAPGRDAAAKWFENIAKVRNDTHDVERRCIQPLQIVEEQRERMLPSRERAQEACGKPFGIGSSYPAG
jgi:hypothetical protein